MKVLFLTHSFPRQPGDAPGSFVLRLATALRGEGIDTRVVAPAAPGFPDHDDARRHAGRALPLRAAPLRDARLHRQHGVAGSGVVERARHDARIPRRRVPVGGARAPRVRAGRRARALVVPEWPRRHVARPHGEQAARDDAARHRRASRALGRVVAPGVSARAAPLGRRDGGVALARRRSAAGRVRAGAGRRADARGDRAVFARRRRAARNRLLFVGRLNKQKGIELLLHALSRIARRVVGLDVVGDGEDRERLLELAAGARPRAIA